MGSYGLNILDKDKTEYAAGTYSMSAILPTGNSLKVKIRGLNWYFSDSHNKGWEYSDWNDIDTSRTFTSTRTGEIDLKILLESYQDSTWSNKTEIYYYENEDSSPNWFKEIIVN